jgi:hypothetical protein
VSTIFDRAKSSSVDEGFGDREFMARAVTFITLLKFAACLDDEVIIMRSRNTCLKETDWNAAIPRAVVKR